jgi:hypothetical protein
LSDGVDGFPDGLPTINPKSGHSGLKSWQQNCSIDPMMLQSTESGSFTAGGAILWGLFGSHIDFSGSGLVADVGCEVGLPCSRGIG